VTTVGICVDEGVEEGKDDAEVDCGMFDI